MVVETCAIGSYSEIKFNIYNRVSIVRLSVLLERTSSASGELFSHVCAPSQKTRDLSADTQSEESSSRVEKYQVLAAKWRFMFAQNTHESVGYDSIQSHDWLRS